MLAQSFSVDLSVSEAGRNRPEYKIDTDLNGEITLQDLLRWTKAALIVTADEVLKEEQGVGFDKKPLMLVDGKQGKDIGAVSPLGQIEFVARQDFTEIVLSAYTALLDLSKVLTGRYKASHYVFHNGHQVATDLSTLQSWIKSQPNFAERDTIRIVNIQPYARRLELLGVTADRQKRRTEDKGRRKGQKTGQMLKVPNGAYQLAYRRIRYMFKNNALIRFKFLPGSQLGLSGKFSAKWGRGRAGRPYLYPSLVIGFQARGVI